MGTKELMLAIITLSEKELRRFMRIWVQTLVPPAVTTSLYFVIFGSLIGPRIGAMDGFDYKFSYELPFLYSSDIYFKGSHWEDGASYNSDSDEFGLTAEVSPNMSLRVASIKTDTKNSDTTGSLSYSIPLGGAKKKIKKLRKLKFTTTLEPIRDQLFKPVQRENRIKKKKVGQVTVSGF